MPAHDHPTLVYNLRSLARFEHADLSIGDEAADMIERQAAEIARLKAGGCARDQTTTQYCAEAAALAAEIERLRGELSAATGYMLNAKIDLETGAPKRTAITTIEGGLRRARDAVLPSPPAER
jgi:uncharacterized small protein (DUF1192 family)